MHVKNLFSIGAVLALLTILSAPASGDVVPVPVRPEDLARVAETTGGQAFEARTGDELASAHCPTRPTPVFTRVTPTPASGPAA